MNSDASMWAPGTTPLVWILSKKSTQLQAVLKSIWVQQDGCLDRRRKRGLDHIRTARVAAVWPPWQPVLTSVGQKSILRWQLCCCLETSKTGCCPTVTETEYFWCIIRRQGGSQAALREPVPTSVRTEDSSVRNVPIVSNTASICQKIPYLIIFDHKMGQNRLCRMHFYCILQPPKCVNLSSFIFWTKKFWSLGFILGQLRTNFAHS